MERYKSFPLNVPANGDVCWVITSNFYNTPFTAIYYSALQVFVSYPAGISIAAGLVSRWKLNLTVFPSPSEVPFSCENYKCFNLNASVLAWYAASATANNNYAVGNLPIPANGYVAAEFLSTLNLYTDFSYIGLSTSYVNSPPSTSIDWLYSVNLNTAGSTYVFRYNGSVQGSGYTAVIGDRFRLRREGSTVYAEVYRSSVWDIMHTFSQSLSGIVYPRISCYNLNNTSRVEKPVIYQG